MPTDYDPDTYRRAREHGPLQRFYLAREPIDGGVFHVRAGSALEASRAAGLPCRDLLGFVEIFRVHPPTGA